jgi:hypothetical protein
MLDTNVSKSNKIPLPALEVLTNFLEKETGHIHRIRGKYIKKYEQFQQGDRQHIHQVYSLPPSADSAKK